MTGTRQVVEAMRSKGYKVSDGYIQNLINEGVIQCPDLFLGRRVWTDSEIKRLEEVLHDRGRHE